MEAGSELLLSSPHAALPRVCCCFRLGFLTGDGSWDLPQGTGVGNMLCFHSHQFLLLTNLHTGF